ncbi:hypothetical protein [Zavarzinella formosa]|uniref:hypothetical protein n=1 Tax=Zavarzinella formosa TaxID=360055 RepID=UPI0003162BC8|nr:hypothetical protein [Zavarzinella formosa]
MWQFRWMIAVAGVVLLAGTSLCQTGAAPLGSPTNKTVEHVRRDEETLRKLGGDSIDAGLNKYGELGYELMLVTSIQETGAAGFHYLKRQPWTAATPRPVFEYKRLDSGQIEKLGGDNFDAGLASLEKENWELVALTTNIKGGAGFHYFKRTKK